MGHLWQEAASMAARMHRGQVRLDGKTPYVAHCFRVAMTLRHVFGCDDDVAITAALLHDAIEDTPADIDEVIEHFGEEVGACVGAMTKNMILIESDREPDYDRRLQEGDWRARLVKLADVYDNLSDLSRPEKLESMLDKCRRAVALARADASDHACVQRAIDEVEALMQRQS